MKPNFALTLSHEGVALVQRSPRGWLAVGEVALNDPAFDEAVAGLRAVAQSLAPDGVFTKVVIPESELLYTVVAVPGPDPEARRTAIRAALEGATPYPVDDLVFDWSGRGTHLNVAVVARETLEEAEAFAAAHGFNPVSFVARPGTDRYIGEPFFGLTAAAKSVLPAGERVERDFVPVQVVGRAERPTTAARPIFGAMSVASAPAAAEAAADKAGSAGTDASAETAPPVAAAFEADTEARADPATGATGKPEASDAAAGPEPAARPAAEAPAPEAPAPEERGAATADAAPPAPPAPAVLPAAREPAPAEDPAPARVASGETGAPPAADLPATPRSGAESPAEAAGGKAADTVAAAAMTTEAGEPGAGEPGSDTAEGDPADEPVPVVFASRRRPLPEPADGAVEPAEPPATAAAAARAAGGGRVAPPPGSAAPDPSPAGSAPSRAPARFSAPSSPPDAALPDPSQPAPAASKDAAPPPGPADSEATRPAAQKTPDGTRPEAASALGRLPAALQGLQGRIGRARDGLAAAIERARPRPPAPLPGIREAGLSGGGHSGAAGPTGAARPPGAAGPHKPGASAPKAGGPAVVAAARSPAGAPRPAAPARPRTRPAVAAVSRMPASGPAQLLASRSSQPLAVDGSATEAEAMTVFGARGQPPGRGRELRTGLILTGALVLLLGGVAVWAAFFLPGSPTEPRETAALAPAPAAGPQGTAEVAQPELLAGDILPGDAAGLLDDAAEAGFAPFNVDESIEDAIAAEAAGGIDGLEDPSTADGLGVLPLAADGTLPDAALPDASATAPPPPLATEAEAELAAPGAGEAPGEPDVMAGEAAELSPEELAAAAVEAALAEELLGLDAAAPEADPTGTAATAALAEASPEELAAAWDETGIWPVAPDPLAAPRAGSLSDLRPVAPDDTLAGRLRQALPDPAEAAPPPVQPAPPRLDPAWLALAAAPPASAPEPTPQSETAAAPPTPASPAPPPAGLPADEADLVITVTAGSPPMVPGLRRELVSRHLLIEGNLPVPDSAEPLPRPAGLGGDSALGASPAAPPATTAVAAATAPAAAAPTAGAVSETAPETVVDTASASATDTAADPEPAAGATVASATAAGAPLGSSPGAAAAPGAIGPAAIAGTTAPAAEEPEVVGRIAAVDATAAGIALRPQARPEGLPTRPGPTVISVAAPTGETPRAPVRPEAVVAAAVPVSVAAASPLAVAASLVPGGRPSDFSILVARAAPPPTPQAAQPQPAAPQQAAPQPAPQQQPAPQPQQAAAVATPAPSLPTRASVAQQATQTRAMNLRQINLIGVFGTASDRRALVRLTNGRIVSVRVGDQLDGGQVAAIGDSELRYVRRGQNNVLRVGG